MVHYVMAGWWRNSPETPKKETIKNKTTEAKETEEVKEAGTTVGVSLFWVLVTNDARRI